MFDNDGDFYERLYDYDGDGKLNSFEKSVMYDDICNDSTADNSSLDSDDNFDFDYDVTLAGLDADELMNMDEDLLRDTLDDAGLDIDDYDLDL